MLTMPRENLCSLCSAPCSLTCGRCRKVAYCSQTHQKTHWKIHKQECVDMNNYKVVKDTSGKHLVAIKSIPEGKIIFREKPLLLAPLTKHEACLGCNKQFSSMYPPVPCSSCGLNVCSPGCEQSDYHKGECKLISGILALQILFSTDLAPYWVLILRYGYLKAHDKSAWSKICDLRSRLPKSVEPIFYRMNIKAFLSLVEEDTYFKDITKEEIQNVIDVYLVNKYTMNLYEALYHKASFIKHNCYPNTYWIISDDGKITFRALRDIEAGEDITATVLYSPINLLLKSKALGCMNMACTCQLCTSPKEPESHSVSIKCLNSTCNGYIVPRLATLSSRYIWRCTKCQYMLSDLSFSYFEALAENYHYPYDDVECTEAYLGILNRLLHPGHFAILALKEEWLMINYPTNGGCLSNKDLGRMYEMWSDLNFAPPSFLKGRFFLRFLLFRLRYELLPVIAERCHQFPFGDRMIDQMLTDIDDAAASLLKHEPRGLDEEVFVCLIRSMRFGIPEVLLRVQNLRRPYTLNGNRG